MKNLFFPIILVISLQSPVMAQPSTQMSGASFATFIDYQKTFAHPDESFRRKEDTLEKQFVAKGLKWPANYVYIRSFKYDSQLEVWVKDELTFSPDDIDHNGGQYMVRMPERITEH